MASQTTARRDAVRNRAALLTAAQSLLAHDPHASIGDIAREAGMSRRTVYGHFADRDALLRELITTGTVRFNALAESSDDADPPPLRLARLAARLWDEAVEVQVAVALAVDEAHVEQTAMALAPLRRRVLGVVQDGQQTQALRTDIPAPTLARLIEESARMTFTRLDPSSPRARDIAILTILGVAGLSWREAAALVASLSGHDETTEH